jgi:hypothetical protein
VGPMEGQPTPGPTHTDPSTPRGEHRVLLGRPTLVAALSRADCSEGVDARAVCMCIAPPPLFPRGPLSLVDTTSVRRNVAGLSSGAAPILLSESGVKGDLENCGDLWHPRTQLTVRGLLSNYLFTLCAQCA